MNHTINTNIIITMTKINDSHDMATVGSGKMKGRNNYFQHREVVRLPPAPSLRGHKNNSTKTIVEQRSLSIYTLLGALQSALWFFALPFLARPLWPIVFGRLSSQAAEVFLYILPAPYFLMYAAVVALPPYLLQWDCFEQYKLSKDPWPWMLRTETEDNDNGCDHSSRRNKNGIIIGNEQRQEDIKILTRNNNFGGDKQQQQQQQRRQQGETSFRTLYLKSLCVDMISVFVYFPTCIYMKTLLLPNTTLSFGIDDWPTIFQSAIVVPAMAICHEFLIYWSHRIMHTYPTLYKYHKIHHEYKQNTILAAQYFHVVDFLATIMGPMVITTMLFRPHSFNQFLVGLWIFTANLDDHLGYAFPWSAVRWFPLSAGTDAHEFHHRVNMGCYGSKLSLWDWVFRTDIHYERWKRGDGLK